MAARGQGSLNFTADFRMSFASDTLPHSMALETTLIFYWRMLWPESPAWRRSRSWFPFSLQYCLSQ